MGATAAIYKGLSNKPRVLDLPCGKSIREALPNEDTGSAFIFAGGKEADENYIIKEGDNIFIRLAPGDMDSVSLGARIFIGIITLGMSEIINIGVQAYKAKAEAEALAAELEKLKQSTNSDIDNRPFLRGASNTAATSQTQPYICGRHLFTPYLLCDPFYELEGEDGAEQRVNIILEGGFNKQVIHTVGTDDIDILTLEGEEPQEGSFLCNAGTAFADGLVEIAQDGKLLEDIPALNYKVVSTNANEEVPKIADIESGEAEDFTFTLDSHAMDVTVCITFNSGLYAYNSDGDKITTQVTVTPQYSLDGGETWKDFAFDNNGTLTNTFSRATSSKELRFAAKKEFSLADYEELYANGQNVIYCRVRSNGNTDSQICNTCYVLYYQSVCFDPNTSSSPAGVLDDAGEAGLVKCLVLNDRERAKSTMIGLRLKATSANEDKLSKVYVISSGLARTWDGAKWSEEKSATRNPAAWALEILTSDSHALSKFSDDEIDLESFGDFYEFCEENEFYFDYVISQKTKKETVLGYITDSCRASLYTDIYGRKAIAIDRPQENALAIYNPQNIISIENSREFARRTDCVRVTFTNSEGDLYEEDTYTVMREEGGVPLELNEDSVITDLTTSGITTYEHVVKYARYMMAVESLRPKKTTIEVGNEGIFFTPYAKVLIQDDSLKIGTGHSVLKGAGWQGGALRWLYLKSPVTIEEGKSYGVIINCFMEDGVAPLPVKVAGETGQVTELEVLSDITVAGGVYPEGGEVLSFGELDEAGEFTRVSTPYVITGISRAEKGFSLELANYDEAIYETGTIPDYAPNITQKPASSAAEIPENAASLDDVYAAVTGAIRNISDGSAETVGAPDAPTSVSAVAEKDGIRLSCSLGKMGLRNDITLVTWEITKADGSVAEAASSAAEGYYYFERETDGYPEAEEIQLWQVRAKALNAYGEESDWSASSIVSTSSYGTWLVSAPSLSAAVSGRTITLTIMQPTLASGKTRYGTFYNRVQIQKPSESGEWLKPASTLDPYADEANWNEGEGFIVVEGTWSQTMPLTGQTLVESEVEGETVMQSSPEDTLYRFRVQAYSEAGEGEPSEINATALGSGIQDLVQGSVTHDKISTPSLSAITANMGVISSGGFTGSELNYWALSTIRGLQASGIADMWQGAFRVGGEDEYLLVEPQVTNSVVTGYKIYFKAGVFEVTAEASAINGELTIQKDASALDRTRITPTGTYWEHRETADAEWQTVAQVTQSGVRASTLISASSLVVSNLPLAERRLLGHDIGRPYLSEAARVWHFDTDFLDQNQKEGLLIEGEARLVDASDSAESIDFTPAILAVSPYTEDAKVAYGQFSAAISLEATSSCTVDFWLQYIWNENQVLFDIGCETDKARLVIANAECYWNEAEGAPFNAEQEEAGDVVVWNEPAESSATIEHYGSWSATESVSLERLGIDLASNEWLHVGVVLSGERLSVFLDTARADFARNSQAAQAVSIEINELAGTFILDELYIDSGAEEAFEDFAANTASRIPWGTLDREKAHFVLDADCLHTNIFDSDIFKEKVKEIIEEMKDGAD